MRNLILCLALGAVASSAFALTNEDLACLLYTSDAADE